MELDQKRKRAISLFSLSLSESDGRNCGFLESCGILATNLEEQEAIIKLFKIAGSLYQQGVGS